MVPVSVVQMTSLVIVVAFTVEKIKALPDTSGDSTSQPTRS